MIEHNKDPGSFYFEIQKNIHKRVIAGENIILTVKPAGGRHISIWMIQCIIIYISSKLKIKPASCFSKFEAMFKISCFPDGGKWKVQNI
jgi:guanylate kinase